MSVLFCRTKAGNGFKVLVDDKWLFTSEKNLLNVLFGKASSCYFDEIEDRE